MPPPPANDSMILLTIIMLLLLLWPITEITEALEELKKLLQTINNSKCTLYISYTIIVILLTCYFILCRSDRNRQRGRVEVADVKEGVEKEVMEGGIYNC